MTSVVPGVLMVILCVLFPVGGLKLVQRLMPVAIRARHNDVAGFIYAVLGVVYAVLVVWAVIAVWQDYDTAKATTESEVNELDEIYFLAGQFSDPERARVQDLARSYTRVVLEEEWPLMDQRETSPRASALMNELTMGVEDLDPRTDAQQTLYDQELTQVYDLADDRELRLLEVREGIPGILWIVLVPGRCAADQTLPRSRSYGRPSLALLRPLIPP